MRWKFANERLGVGQFVLNALKVLPPSFLADEITVLGEPASQLGKKGAAARVGMLGAPFLEKDTRTSRWDNGVMSTIPGLENPPTRNKKLLEWVEEVAALTQPDRVEWSDGSQEEWDRLTQLLVDGGPSPGDPA